MNRCPTFTLPRKWTVAPVLTLLCTIAAPLWGQAGGEEITLQQLDGQAATDHFGGAVAGVGDVNGDGVDDFMVGAASAAHGSLDSAGSVRVYSGATGAILYQFYGSAYADYFGISLANAGDVNGDGVNDLIIGASGSQVSAVSPGYASVYSGATGSLIHRFYGPHPASRFGIAVASAGDIDQDGFSDLIIGASFADSASLPGVGGAYVYSGSTGSLLVSFFGHAYLDYFGSAVANAGDLNGDGVNDILVGAYGVDGVTGYPPIGSAYAFSGSTGFQLWHYNGGNGLEHLGASVAGLGDINHDGFDDVIIGAPLSGTNANGAAVIYSGATREKLYQINSNTHSGNLGKSVAGVGDMDGDGTPDFLVGGVDAGAYADINRGSAFLYSGATGQIVHRFWGTGIGGEFGSSSSLSLAGDVNGDGQQDIIVGADSMSPGGLAYAGAAYVLSFHPFLSSTRSSLSALTGGIVNLSLDFPELANGHDYKVLMSGTGTGPTTYGVEVPLTRDSLVRNTFLDSYPMSTHSNLQGTLNANGDANASFTLFAGLTSNLIGRTFWLAAIANPPGQLPTYSSVALPIEILP